MREVMIINGVDPNLLGKREPEVYGSQALEDYLAVLQTQYPKVTLHYFRSNSEGKLIDKIHEVGFIYNDIILNAGGCTHTSVALTDAVRATSTPVVEVYISDIFAHEAFRHHSYPSPVMRRCIAGFGVKSCKLTLQSFIS